MNQRHSLMVLTKAVTGRRAELERWYDERHIPDLLKIPGFIAAERHVVETVKSPTGAPTWDFLVKYDIEGDDPMSVYAEAGRRMGTSQMMMSEALESSSTVAVIATSMARSGHTS